MYGRSRAQRKYDKLQHYYYAAGDNVKKSPKAPIHKVNRRPISIFVIEDILGGKTA